MSTVNAVTRELSAKLVYYGPGLSGKTTTLQALHTGVRPESRGQLSSPRCPAAAVTEGDALFALYVLVAAQVKAERL